MLSYAFDYIFNTLITCEIPTRVILFHSMLLHM